MVSDHPRNCGRKTCLGHLHDLQGLAHSTHSLSANSSPNQDETSFHRGGSPTQPIITNSLSFNFKFYIGNVCRLEGFTGETGKSSYIDLRQGSSRPESPPSTSAALGPSGPSSTFSSGPCLSSSVSSGTADERVFPPILPQS